MKIAAFIVARQSSSRLPGKALALIEDKPVLEHISLRLKESPHISEIWFVTSTLPSDDGIAELGKKLGIKVHRGHPEDVLARIYTASLETNCDYILEVGGDCPLVDADLIKKGLEVFDNSGADFVSNAFHEPFTYPVGYDFILFSRKAIQRAHELAQTTAERFQPFQFIIKHPEKFSYRHFSSQENLNEWRWTMDYPEDLEFLRRIFSELKSKGSVFSYSDLVQLLKAKPEITAINGMYAEKVQKSTAWYTGSFSRELTQDIQKLLQDSLELETKKDWDLVCDKYAVALTQLQELKERAEHFLEKRNSNA